MNLEALLEHVDGFAVPLTSCQRAIARIMTGEPLEELSHDPDVIEMVGGQAALEALPSVAPDMVVLGAAVRCGKSTLVAAKALRNAYLGDCSGLAPGEIPRVAILSVDLDKSRETFSKIVGALESSPLLSQLLVKPPGPDSVLVRNKSGRPVEIKVVAGARAGKTLVSRWLLGFIADEAPRMVGSEQGVINLDDALSAVVARMRPGAQIDLVGSPWAPSGTFYELVTKRHGRPGADLVVLIATGPMLRPSLYTPEYCERIRTSPAGDRSYEADVMARFSDSESSLVPSVDVNAAVGDYSERRPAPGWNYTAIMDPATRGNGWTLVVLGTQDGRKFELVLAREWIGSRSQPLRASVVMREMSVALAPFSVTDVYTDQWGFDILRDVAELVDAGFGLLQVDRDDEVAGKRVVQLLTEHSLKLPDNKQLRQDLVAIKRKPRQGGGSQIVLPTTADGRHCDYGAAVLLGMQVLPTPPEPEAPQLDDETLYCLRLQAQRADGAMNAAGRRLMGM